VLRPKADGSHALLLDYSGNLLDHGLPDRRVAWSLKGRERAPAGEGTEKLCPNCEAIVAAGVSECPECGHVFVQRGQEIMGLSPGDMTEIDFEQIARLRDLPYRQVLESARSFDDLKLIAAARRYADGWVYHAAKARGIAIPSRERSMLTPVAGGWEERL
jgi:hypothetical protein